MALTGPWGCRLDLSWGGQAALGQVVPGKAVPGQQHKVLKTRNPVSLPATQGALATPKSLLSR
eukprot:1152982-Pelagomonas_calceolata.AAC.1